MEKSEWDQIRQKVIHRSTKKSNLLQIAGYIAKQLTQYVKSKILLSFEKYFVKSSSHQEIVTCSKSVDFTEFLETDRKSKIQ